MAYAVLELIDPKETVIWPCNIVGELGAENLKCVKANVRPHDPPWQRVINDYRTRSLEWDETWVLDSNDVFETQEEAQEAAGRRS